MGSIMKKLSKVLIETYDGQWDTFPSPTDTLEDYDSIIWKTDTPPTLENLKDLGVFPTLADRLSAEPIRLLRVERDKLLASSDWTGLADTALTNEQAAKWKLYRQKLRDFPSGLDTEFKVKNAVWPTKP